MAGGRRALLGEEIRATLRPKVTELEIQDTQPGRMTWAGHRKVRTEMRADP